MTYYNDIDRFCTDWLNNLIKVGAISDGLVDGRSITELKKTYLGDYERVHLFAGIGGWDYALQLAGFPQGLPVWTGSCPCQPFSRAGLEKGFNDERDLWKYMCDLIAQYKPPIVFGEQVASKLGRDWFARVRADLEALGYAVGGADLCAPSVGSPHMRQRLYWMGYRDEYRCEIVKWFKPVVGSREYIDRFSEDSGIQDASGLGYRRWDNGYFEGYEGELEPENQTAGSVPHDSRVSDTSSDRLEGGRTDPQNSKMASKMLLRDQCQLIPTGYPTPLANKTTSSSEEKRQARMEKHNTHFSIPLGTVAGFLVWTEKLGVLNPELSRWLMGFPQKWCEVSPNYEDFIYVQAQIESDVAKATEMQ